MGREGGSPRTRALNLDALGPAARMAAFSPGQSPRPVNTPIRTGGTPSPMLALHRLREPCNPLPTPCVLQVAACGDDFHDGEGDSVASVSPEVERFDDFFASTAPVLVRQVFALTGDLAEA